VPKQVRGPCLLNVVRGGKTPEIDLLRAQEMGYRLAIVPGLLLKAVIGACDEMLAQLKAGHIHPVPRSDMTVREAFNRVGALEWDALRTRFRDAVDRRAAE
jgi:2-methylisocitrate lyase-like PEP mutase family enzyme